MSYELRFSREAAEDLSQAFEYISLTLTAPKAAGELMRKLDKNINLLREQPFMGTPCRDEPLREMGYRRLVVQHYVVVYSVSEASQTVYILRVFYGGRDYEKYIR